MYEADQVIGPYFSNQSRIPPRVSSRRNRSVVVLYDYNSNAILTNPFKNQTTQELVRSQTRLIQYLLYWGLKTMEICNDNK